MYCNGSQDLFSPKGFWAFHMAGGEANARGGRKELHGLALICLYLLLGFRRFRSPRWSGRFHLKCGSSNYNTGKDNQVALRSCTEVWNQQKLSTIIRKTFKGLRIYLVEFSNPAINWLQNVSNFGSAEVIAWARLTGQKRRPVMVLCRPVDKTRLYFSFCMQLFFFMLYTCTTAWLMSHLHVEVASSLALSI